MGCIECRNFRTKKEYTRDGSYRVGFCVAFGKVLNWNDDLKIYDDANRCYVKERGEQNGN